ncbi:hypothetical protein KH201010_25780 [Edwardsiella ictaluri]|nr:hypothetical protein KH20906_25760 [Edwardsiella ictaluri]BEI06792.1 hypothetical protein KH201010_25780 [Edwardsiella ictaluri]BEI10259.1 hypothetical protein STU22726_25900 [Edwardsiella ictaluri]BEI13738.1 hypothetical protein STU22816_25910 [Edwardsiella ictaluri]BEI17210.1 hypothetical protein STA22820_25830 [Edwardsiella ictaluri]
MDLLGVDIACLATHRCGIHIQVLENIHGGAHTGRPSDQRKVIVTVIDFDPQAAFEQFDIAIKRAAQTVQPLIVSGFKQEFFGCDVQINPLD